MGRSTRSELAGAGLTYEIVPSVFKVQAAGSVFDPDGTAHFPRAARKRFAAVRLLAGGFRLGNSERVGTHCRAPRLGPGSRDAASGEGFSPLAASREAHS